MGCFLSCFRGGSDTSSDLRDPLVRESRVGDAFLNDEKRIEAGVKLDVEVADGGGVDEELRREANYLKSCGTISQTPPEILEFSSPTTSEDPNERNDTSSNVQVMEETKLPEGNLSEVSKSDEPDSLIKQHNIDEGIIRVEFSSTATSEDTNEHNDTSSNVQVMEETKLLEGNLSEVSKSDEPDSLIQQHNIDEGNVWVESESGSSSQDNSSFRTIRDQKTDSSDSPYPTPLVLRGDIDTPGTVYTACMGTSKHGKRARASRQFIYPVLRPIENKLQWMELKAAESPVIASNPPKRRNLISDFGEKPQHSFASSTATETESPKSDSLTFHDYCAEQGEISPDELKGQNIKQQLFEGGEELLEQDSEYGKPGVSSLAYWLKPSSADDESQGDPNTEDNDVEKEPCYENSVFEVPIFPASGFNWDIDNPTPVLSKAWDGNGIPNTTTKYKEDQRVSWHATPFEERLMKVLSDEKPLHERKISGKLIHLEENAE